MIRAIAMAAASLAGLCAVAPKTLGHSWYPKDCCSDRDCMLADSVETDVRGDLQVKVGKLRIWVPKGFAVRPSNDSHVHICFREEKDLKFLMPLCLFMPALS